MLVSCASLIAILPYVFHFIFQGHGNLRDLHSFPTRRSSDLSRPTPVRLWPIPTSVMAHRARRGRNRARRRSEEHTSELQSRGHLVCRLLLEKKNEKRRIGKYGGLIQ